MSVTKPPISISWNTSISVLEPELLYRGYRVEELTQSATFLETAFALIADDLPTSEQLADWQALLLDGMTLPDEFSAWLKRVPTSANSLEVLVGAFTRWQLSGGCGFAPAPDVLDSWPQWLGFVTAILSGRQRLLKGEKPLVPRDDLGYVGNLWWLIQGTEPTTEIVQAIEPLLILGAEHGLNPAAVAVRMAAVSGLHFPSALQVGIQFASGWQPVRQAEETLDVLRDVRQVERAGDWVAVMTQRQQPIAGFEHRVYRVGDPRTDLIVPWCRKWAESRGRIDREELASAIEQAVWDQCQRLPAVVWPAARLLDYLGLDRTLFGPLFVLARMAGWAAHYHEQSQSPKAPVMAFSYIGNAVRPVSKNTD